MNKDSFHELKPVVALATATIATDTDTNSDGVDLSGFESVLFALVAATIADGEYTVKVQHSDDDGATDPYVDVDVDGMIFTDAASKLDGTTDDKILKIGYRGDSVNGSKKFARLVVTSVSTTTGGTFTVVAVLGDARIGVLSDDVA